MADEMAENRLTRNEFNKQRRQQEEERARLEPVRLERLAEAARRAAEEDARRQLELQRELQRALLKRALALAEEVRRARS